LKGAVTNSGTLYVSGANTEFNDVSPVQEADNIKKKWVADEKSYVVAGDYVQKASGTLKIDVKSDTSYSKLVVKGDATFPSDAKIDVNVIGAPELSIGSTIDGIVSVDGDLTADNTFEVTDNSALLDFKGLENGDTIDLLIEVGESSVLGSVQQNSNSPAAGVAKLIDELRVDDNNTLGLQSLITALVELETEAEVSVAASQLLPLLTGNQTTVLSGAVGEISQVIQGRVEGLQGMSSGDAMPSEQQGQIFDDSYMWVKGFGSMADQDTVAGVTGFDADSSGLVIGLDGASTDKDRIGVAFAYAQTDVDSKDNLNKVDINTYQLVGYGSHSLNDNTQFSYQASYGVHQSEGSRNISLVSNIATSDFDSTSMGAGFGLLHSFKISDQLTITPSIRNDYTYMDNDGYTETGAGSLNLIVDSNDSEQWLFDLGSKAVYHLTETIHLTGNLGASYDVINEQSTSLSAFAGSPGNVFTTQGLKSDPWLYSAGIGLIMETDSGTEITASYDYSTDDDFDNQSVSVKARWVF
jgi:outer membrane autotransporter protein